MPFFKKGPTVKLFCSCKNPKRKKYLWDFIVFYKFIHAPQSLNPGQIPCQNGFLLVVLSVEAGYKKSQCDLVVCKMFNLLGHLKLFICTPKNLIIYKGFFFFQLNIEWRLNDGQVWDLHPWKKKSNIGEPSSPIDQTTLQNLKNQVDVSQLNISFCF